ncbi:MAG: orotate phosphoribosyltransferase [Eubacteriales bacterium]
MIDGLKLLKESQALLEGHFLLSSGKHSPKYVQCAKLMQYTDKAEKMVSIVAEKVKDLDIDLIVGPAMGGIRPAYELGRQLDIRTVFTERIHGKMTLRRGFEIKKDEKILIMEDVVTTGKSSLETAKALEKLGGKVIAIGCLVDRKVSNLNIPIYSSIELFFETFEEKECPMCKENSKAVKPGSRNL